MKSGKANAQTGNSPPGDSRYDRTSRNSRFTIKWHVLFGTTVMCLLLFVLGGWSATAQLTSAIIAPGTVVVEKHVKKLQHRDGGIVASINVKNGDFVKAGQILMKIDDTQIRAELGIVESQLIELSARGARLAAEYKGLNFVSFPSELFAMGRNSKQVATEEERLFVANKTGLQSQESQLKLQIEQLKQEINGIKAQREGKRGQLDLVALELKQIQRLYKLQLTPIQRVYSMEREIKRLGGEHGGLVAQIARAKGKISETELQILSIAQSARTRAQRELRTVEGKLSELKERRNAALDRLQRCILRAPQSGFIHELGVHTIGGVIVAAEPILLIVPMDEKLTIEVRFSPIDIDQITLGRKVMLRFSAFDQKSTPELEGRVIGISADISTDAANGQRYYMGRIEIDQQNRQQSMPLKLLPGMPVEAFITTGERTALSYLLKPFSDQIQRTFREK